MQFIIDAIHSGLAVHIYRTDTGIVCEILKGKKVYSAKVGADREDLTQHLIEEAAEQALQKWREDEAV